MEPRDITIYINSILLLTLYGISLHYIRGQLCPLLYPNNKIPDYIYLILTPPKQHK